MQKENLMETVVSVAAPAPVETPVPGELAGRTAPSVLNAVIAVRGQIETRLDALKEYVLSYMDVERRCKSIPRKSAPMNCRTCCGKRSRF